MLSYIIFIDEYISKNIDGRGLAGEISKETGKSLRDNAEYVNAWASLHRVQQFRFFGIPGRQAYRELRLLAGRVVALTLIPILVAAFSYPLGNRKMMELCPASMTTIGRVYGMTICSMPFWLLLMLVVLPPTS